MPLYLAPRGGGYKLVDIRFVILDPQNPLKPNLIDFSPLLTLLMGNMHLAPLKHFFVIGLMHVYKMSPAPAHTQNYRIIGQVELVEIFITRFEAVFHRSLHLVGGEVLSDNKILHCHRTHAGVQNFGLVEVVETLIKILLL